MNPNMNRKTILNMNRMNPNRNLYASRKMTYFLSDIRIRKNLTHDPTPRSDRAMTIPTMTTMRMTAMNTVRRVPGMTGTMRMRRANSCVTSIPPALSSSHRRS